MQIEKLPALVADEPLLFLLILAAISLILIGFGKLQDRWEEEFRKNGIQTQGTVMQNRFCLGHTSVFRPIVQFYTQSGELVEALDENGLALAVPRFSEGQKILLIYEKGNPRNFRILTNGQFV